MNEYKPTPPQEARNKIKKAKLKLFSLLCLHDSTIELSEHEIALHRILDEDLDPDLK